MAKLRKKNLNWIGIFAHTIGKKGKEEKKNPQKFLQNNCDIVKKNQRNLLTNKNGL